MRGYIYRVQPTDLIDKLTFNIRDAPIYRPTTGICQKKKEQFAHPSPSADCFKHKRRPAPVMSVKRKKVYCSSVYLQSTTGFNLPVRYKTTAFYFPYSVFPPIIAAGLTRPFFKMLKIMPNIYSLGNQISLAPGRL